MLHQILVLSVTGEPQPKGKNQIKIDDLGGRGVRTLHGSQGLVHPHNLAPVLEIPK